MLCAMNSVHAVIMAGGAGTRFWPASRQTRPKQLLPLANGEPMIAATLQRLAHVTPAERRWIVTNRRQKRALQRRAQPTCHVLQQL